jgi:hypothetical protein
MVQLCGMLSERLDGTIRRWLVDGAVRWGIPFRAVVADSFYGEDRGFKRFLQDSGISYRAFAREVALAVARAGHDRRFVGVGSCGRGGRRWETRGMGEGGA